MQCWPELKRNAACRRHFIWIVKTAVTFRGGGGDKMDSSVSDYGYGPDERGTEFESRQEERCRIWGSHSGGNEEYYLLGYNAV
jgi:hypothetical protein